MKTAILVVSILLSAEITQGFSVNCGSSSSHWVALGNSITILCKADRVYDYCKVHVGGQTCQFDWKSYGRLPSQGDCADALKSRLSFVGKMPTKSDPICTVRLSGVSMADFGQWKMEVKAWDNPQEVTSARKSVAVEEQGDTVGTNFTVDTTCFEKNTNYHGSDLETLHQIASPKECQARCQLSTNCQYWTINSGNICYFKSEASLIRREQGQHMRAVSGPRYCPACFHFDQALLGSQSTLTTISGAGSLLECQSTCKRTNGCSFFSYNTKSRACKLMREKEGAGPQADSVYGPAECPKARWSEWTEWSQPCQGVCDQGTQSRARKCFKDEPTAQCEGSDQDIETAQQGCILDNVCPTTTESPGGISNSSVDWLPIVIPIAIILLIVVLLLVFLFKNKERFMGKPRGLVIYANTKSSAKSGGDSRNINNSTRPIPTNKFRDELRHERIPTKDEFSQLNDEDQRQHVLMFPNEVGKKYNMRGTGNMNRYANILPYDKNRIILKGPINGCDYINASWINNLGVKFIAAQGPLPHTVQHFLQMLVENDVRMVIMLTRTEEQDSNGSLKKKCEQYWAPNGSSKTFGSTKVETISEEEVIEVQGIIKRVCQITTNGGHPHQFMQYQCSSWPDFGVPEQSKPLIDLVQLVRLSHFGDTQQEQQQQQPPILVHCSAGVGRTGTFMGLFGIMREIDTKAKVVDVYKTVLDMRRDRVQMVQKSGQYKFLHECVACYLRQVDGTNDHMQSDYIYSI